MHILQYAISGLVYGGAYAILGVCLVVMIRMVRVLNFAQAAIGAFGAYVAVELSDHGFERDLAERQERIRRARGR